MTNTTGHNNGVLVRASTSEIEGLTVEDALGGGIVSNVFWHVGTRSSWPFDPLVGRHGSDLMIVAVVTK